MPSVPMLEFDGSTLAPEHDFEMFHDTTRPLFETSPLGDLAAFRSHSADYLVDDLVVSRIRYGPQTFRRTERQLRGGSSEWVTIQVYLSGHLTGRSGDRVLDFDPQRVGVLDLSEPLAAWSGETDAIWVSIPRSRLAHVDDRYGAHHLRTFNRSSPRGRILGAAIERLWRQLPNQAAEDAPELAAGLIETVDSALATRTYQPSDHDLLTAMEHHVAAHLDDLDLTTTSLREAFHCSRSVLYRLFEPHHGVANYIREQRLIRCFDELSRPADHPPLVWQVATRWGFENPSHFHRLFVGMFGLPPSSLTRRPTYEPAGGQRDPGIAAHITSFRRWAEADTRAAPS